MAVEALISAGRTSGYNQAVKDIANSCGNLDEISEGGGRGLSRHLRMRLSRLFVLLSLLLLETLLPSIIEGLSL